MFTVHNLLKLDDLKDSVLLAGESGLDNQIENISVIDAPVMTDDIIKIDDNNFYLSGLYAYKDQPEKMIEMFKVLKKENCSGLCLVDVVFSTLPNDCVEYCNENKIPVILISKHLPYANVISKVYQELITIQNEERKEAIINSLLLEGLSDQIVKQNAKLLNINFNEINVAIFCSFKEPMVSKIRNIEILNKNSSVYTYGEGILILLTNKDDKSKVRQDTQHLIDKIKRMSIKYTIGVSSIKDSLGDVNVSISEAITAHNAAKYIKRKTVRYQELGVYKILSSIKNDQAMVEFSEHILKPIRKYDAKKQSNLMETVEAFVEFEGDLKEVGKKLFVHTNTIRYRMEKVADILGFKQVGYALYEQLSLAIKSKHVIDSKI